MAILITSAPIRWRGAISINEMVRYWVVSAQNFVIANGTTQTNSQGRIVVSVPDSANGSRVLLVGNTLDSAFSNTDNARHWQEIITVGGTNVPDPQPDVYANYVYWTEFVASTTPAPTPPPPAPPPGGACVAPSANNTELVGSSPSGGLCDTNLDRWTVVGGVIHRNGNVMENTANVILLLWYNGFIFQKNNENNWWRWTGSNWAGLGANDPRNVAPAPPGPPPAPPPGPPGPATPGPLTNGWGPADYPNIFTSGSRGPNPLLHGMTYFRLPREYPGDNGLGDDPPPTYTAKVRRQVNTSGLFWNSREFDGSYVQGIYRPGGVQNYYWGALDEVLQWCWDNDHRWLANPWMTPQSLSSLPDLTDGFPNQKGGHAAPKDSAWPETYNFINAYISRYNKVSNFNPQGRKYVWMIEGWNEPDVQGWVGGPGGAPDYWYGTVLEGGSGDSDPWDHPARAQRRQDLGRWQKTLYQATKDADPSVPVAGPGFEASNHMYNENHHDGHKGAGLYILLYNMQLNVGGQFKDFMDVINFHPYLHDSYTVQSMDSQYRLQYYIKNQVKPGWQVIDSESGQLRNDGSSGDQTYYSNMIKRQRMMGCAYGLWTQCLYGHTSHSHLGDPARNTGDNQTAGALRDAWNRLSGRTLINARITNGGNSIRLEFSDGHVWEV